jgi:Uma2 family endonuclease
MSEPAVAVSAPSPVVYPDSDGNPMADNTLQFQWIQLLQGNLDAVLPDFVAGDLLWYPVQGDPKTRVAPDLLVALGRPKGYRGSYRTWDEANVVPQVVAEVISPSNSWPEMTRKMLFYLRYGVQEYWVIDPEAGQAYAYGRNPSGEMESIGEEGGFVSRILGVRFERRDGDLRVFFQDGSPFRSLAEERARAEAEKERAEAEKERAEAEKERAEAEKERADRLRARLIAAGLDPDAA